jgi:hypothetical protein
MDSWIARDEATWKSSVEEREAKTGQLLSS